MTRHIKLAQSALRVIRSEGYKAFLRYLINWIKGRRGAYKPGQWPYYPPMTYDDFWRQLALTPEQYTYQRETVSQIDPQPVFAIFTKTPDTPDSFQRLADSCITLLEQTYPIWIWYIVCEDDTHKQALQGITAKHNDRIILVDTVDAIIAQRKADLILYLQEGDQLALEALYLLAEQYSRSAPDVIYSDYDYLHPQEHFVDPVFKPDWSPELMLSFNLLRHLACFRREHWEKYGFDIDSHDFALKVSEESTIIHIPRVLYHRRVEHRDADFRVPPEAIATFLREQGLHEPQVILDEHGAIKVSWIIPKERLVSVIIPSRDQPTLLKRCLSTLFEKTSYKNFEIILIDTGSTDPETQTIYDLYSNDPRFYLVRYTESFNFSRACNLGAEHANGELLLFLNNDTEILHADWLHLMAQWFEQPAVGIVGAKLLYPDGRLQHVGHIVGLYGITGHIMQGSTEHVMTIFGSDDWYRNYMAVTGACLMISRHTFEEVGRFDEAYQLNYSDVELCLAVHRAGYRIIYTPHVRLIHHESASHQKQVPIEDTERFHKRLQPISNDPFFNPNLTYQSVIPDLKKHSDDTVATYYKIRARMIQEAMKSAQT